MEALNDDALWASKATCDWPTPSLVSQLNREKLQGLPAVFRKGKLDNMVKVRLLLACLFLPPQDLQSLRPELQELSAAACEDEDEWVRVMGAAVGDYSGQLDLVALVEGPHRNSLVAGTLQALWDGLSTLQPAPGFRPLQEALMHPDVLPREAAAARRSRSPSPALASPNPHFSVRSMEEGSRLPLAPPPLAQLLDGTASLTGAGLDGKSEHARRRGQLAGGAAPTSSMFLTGQHAAHASTAGAARHASTVVSLPAASVPGAGLAVAAPAAHALSQAPEALQSPTAAQAQAQPLQAQQPAAGAPMGLAAAGRLPSLAIGKRPSKLKSLELQESLQLRAAAAQRGGRLQGQGRGATAQQQAQQAQPLQASSQQGMQDVPAEDAGPADMEVDPGAVEQRRDDTAAGGDAEHMEDRDQQDLGGAPEEGEVAGAADEAEDDAGIAEQTMGNKRRHSQVSDAADDDNEEHV